MILKLHEDESTSKVNFLKIEALWTSAHKNRIDQPGQIK